MLSVESTKNIDDYKSDFVAGFDIKETFSIAIGLVIGVAVIILCDQVLHVPILFCPYIAAPFIVIPIVNKFYKKNGMNFFEAKKREKKQRDAVGLSSVSTESAKTYLKYYKAETVKADKEASKEEDFEKQLKKLKKIAIISGLAILVTIILLVLLKVFVLKG